MFIPGHISALFSPRVYTFAYAPLIFVYCCFIIITLIILLSFADIATPLMPLCHYAAADFFLSLSSSACWWLFRLPIFLFAIMLPMLATLSSLFFSRCCHAAFTPMISLLDDSFHWFLYAYAFMIMPYFIDAFRFRWWLLSPAFFCRFDFIDAALMRWCLYAAICRWCCYAMLRVVADARHAAAAAIDWCHYAWLIFSLSIFTPRRCHMPLLMPCALFYLFSLPLSFSCHAIRFIDIFCCHYAIISDADFHFCRHDFHDFLFDFWFDYFYAATLLMSFRWCHFLMLVYTLMLMPRHTID